ncbi:MAG: hypothetical protein ACI8TX_001873 [Hyphomicrobiaceae bacterium]|jgi:hypothetical protein
MDMGISTPALLFPAISLLLLAYTNRFLVLASVIRQLNSLEANSNHDLVIRQIGNLRTRLSLIRSMQSFGVLAFIFCAMSMFALFVGWISLGKILFGASLLLLVVSLLISLYEVQISTHAISIELERFEH